MQLLRGVEATAVVTVFVVLVDDVLEAGNACVLIYVGRAQLHSRRAETGKWLCGAKHLSNLRVIVTYAL